VGTALFGGERAECDLLDTLDNLSIMAQRSIVAGKGTDPTKQLDALEARKLLSRILLNGAVVFSRHARQEMEADDLNEPDVVNILRAGMISDPPDLERGTWRFRVETDRMCAVVGFVARSEVVVVTVWRKKGRGL
jgi:Domain of unknown function (DUF4258)